jgi:hypothetical protein
LFAVHILQADNYPMRKPKAGRLAWSLTGLAAGTGCIIALIQGNASLSRGNVVLLGILGTIFFFGGTIGLKWHKGPVPIGTVVRTCMLLFVCAALMTTVCIIEWPKSPEEIAESIIKKIEERQAANTNSNHLITSVKPCRADKLSDCSDEQLYQWGVSLDDGAYAVLQGYVHAMEEARKNSDREIKNEMYQRAAISLASDFRDCCALDTLKYLEEVKLRVGGSRQRKSDGMA